MTLSISLAFLLMEGKRVGFGIEEEGGGGGEEEEGEEEGEGRK